MTRARLIRRVSLHTLCKGLVGKMHSCLHLRGRVIIWVSMSRARLALVAFFSLCTSEIFTKLQIS